MLDRPQEFLSMMNTLLSTAKEIEGRAAYFSMALGALLAISAIGVVGAIVSGEWDPEDWGLALGIVIALLVSSSAVSVGGLLVASWVYGRPYRALTTSEAEYTRRDLARSEVEKARVENLGKVVEKPGP